MTRPVLLVLALLAVAGPARGDAIVTTRAMRASTIAEYFVDDERLAVDLEIGLADVAAFANLLPDDVYESLGHEPAPLAERLVTFFGEDFTVQPDGVTIAGLIVEMGPRERIGRDEITGEPVTTPGDEPETVIFARIEYELPPRPETITIGGRITAAAGIGFVLYHQSIAVNDFRYLSPAQTVRLDWEDPWYSRFDVRGLRRAYDAPMNGFLYVEPYEVRKEIIARPKDLQRWLDLGLAGRETIPVAMQADLKRAVAAFLRDRHPVVIDGRTIEPELARINFLERTLRSSRVIEPPRELDLDAATLGIIFVYPTDGLPQLVTLEWDLFDERITSVPTAAVDQAGPLPARLDPEAPTLEWRNFLKRPEMPTMTVIAPPPTPLTRAAARGRWPLLALSLALAAWCAFGAVRGARLAPRVVAFAGVGLLAAGCFRVGAQAGLSDERARAVVGGLLHNVYRAFDFRDEETIYDLLAQSVEGDLLTRTYLEMRAGLELANQGGARAKVKEVDLVELSAEPGRAGGFVATAQWDVTGAVGHWGHVHQRRNRYRARLDVRPEEGAWKLADLEVIEEERLTPGGA